MTEQQKLAQLIKQGYERNGWKEKNIYIGIDGSMCPLGATFCSLHPDADLTDANDVCMVDEDLIRDNHKTYEEAIAARLGINSALALAVSNAHQYHGIGAKDIVSQLEANSFDVVAYPNVGNVHSRWLSQ